MVRSQSLHSSRPLLMRSHTAPTSSSSVYSVPSTSSELTVCRCPSTNSSFSNLSYSSAILGRAASSTYQGSTPELPVIPERYRRYGDQCRGKSCIQNGRQSEVMMPDTTSRIQTSLQKSPGVSQDEIRFWQDGSSRGTSESIGRRYAASSISLADMSVQRTPCAPNRRTSRVEKRKRSYESLRKGKFTTNDGAIVHTRHNSSMNQAVGEKLGSIILDNGDAAIPEPVTRRQSRTLVKKRQPWDSPPRGNRRSRI